MERDGVALAERLRAAGMSLNQPRPPIACVTGVDEQQFDQIFLLMASLRRNSPGIALHVCDFGMSDRQRDFLRRKNMLLEVPPGLGRGRHPWDCKAALGRYVAPLGAEAVVWLDADLIVLSDLGPLLAELNASLRQSGQGIAAAGTGTIAGQLAIDPAPHYASEVARYNPDLAYINSGFFLCRSAEFLRRWDQRTQAMSYEKLYEQNAFNLVACESREAVRVLDSLVWNACGQDVRLMTVERSERGVVVTGHRGQPHILHATSTDRARDIVIMILAVVINGIPFKPRLRMIRHPDMLLELQKELVLDSLKREFGLLEACGLGSSE
jgi:hypothetical protein